MWGDIRAKTRRLDCRVLPLLLLACLAVTLISLGVNQSSVGMYHEGPGKTAGLGVDRPIRSDEWYVRLPWLVSQSIRDFPATLNTAGTHDAAVTYDLPVRSPEIILKPHLIPYLVLGIDHAVAAEWWILVIGSACAVYLLLLTIRVRPSLAFGLAAFVSLSPGLHWWNVNSSFSIILYSSLGASSLLSAFRAPPGRRVWLLSGISGWMFSCSAIVLYPPFQVPTMMSILVLLVVNAIAEAKAGRTREILPAIAISATVFASTVAWFVVQHRSGLHAMAGTVYPGTRRSNSGGVDPASLLGVPYDLKASGITAGSVNGTNQSENSSTFLISLPMLLLIPNLQRLREAGRDGATLLCLAVWHVVLLLWMLVPMPDLVGQLTFLNRVPPDRLKPSIIFLSMLMAAIFLSRFRNLVSKHNLVLSLIAFWIVTLWAGSRFTVNDVHLDTSEIWSFSSLWFIPLVIFFLGAERMGVLLLAGVALLTSVHINPFHSSIDAIRKNSLSSAVLRVDPERDGHWMTFSGTAQIRGVLVSNGLAVDSSVSPYPDLTFWRRFDPEETHRDQWNRYAHVQFVLTRDTPKILSTQSDVVEVHIDPCAGDGPVRPGTFFVESSPETIRCATVVDTFAFQGITWHILRKV